MSALTVPRKAEMRKEEISAIKVYIVSRSHTANICFLQTAAAIEGRYTSNYTSCFLVEQTHYINK